MPRSEPGSMPYVAGALVGVGASRSTGPARSRAGAAPLDESSPPGSALDSAPGRPPGRLAGPQRRRPSSATRAAAGSTAVPGAQAARNSSCAHCPARARWAGRSTAADRDGAFNTGARQASSLPVVPGRGSRSWRASQRRLSHVDQLEQAVVVGRIAPLDLGQLRWCGRRRSPAAGSRAGPVRVWWAAQHRRWDATDCPPQVTRTRSRPAATSTRRPMAEGCTE